MASVASANRPDGASLRLIIVDNDAVPSARDMVTNAAKKIDLSVTYVHAPQSNISIARNAALDTATGDWIAFLDDDEVVTVDWLTELLQRQAATDADAVFGYALAAYDDTAPDWIVSNDFHSHIPAARGDVVETGPTCNVLLRWARTAWINERFDLARGQSGGEDTEFFFRLRRKGARYAIAPKSIVYEKIPPARLQMSWLLKRRFRMGQSYTAKADSLSERLRLFLAASAKAGYCGLRALLAAAHPSRRAFWLLRSAMHAGVCAGCLKVKQRALYKEEAI